MGEITLHAAPLQRSLLHEGLDCQFAHREMLVCGREDQSQDEKRAYEKAAPTEKLLNRDTSIHC